MTAPRAFSAASSFALLACVVLLPACAKSCKNDRPYVPYTVGETGPGSDGGAGASTPSSASAEPPKVTVTPALVAPARATSWHAADGLEIVAPPGRELALALVEDLDGDGSSDALVVVKPMAEPGGPNGSADLYMQPGARKGSAFPAPALLLSGPLVDAKGGCAPTARLERIGKRSAYVELGTACGRAAGARAAAVVRLAAAPSTAWSVNVVDPPSAPRLSLEVDGADRDKDGIDDVAVRVTLDDGSAKASAKLAFFDRPAGASRDPDEPEASLRAIAQQATARAGRVKDAPAVPALVAQVRALYRAMCDEGGAPRLLKRGGAGGAVSCGTSSALEDAGVADVRSAVITGDALRAGLASLVAQASPAKRTPARTSELGQLLGQVAPIVSARSARVLTPTSGVDVTRARHPEWGPLTFDGAGRVLVRGGGRVVAIDPASGEEQASEVPPWPSQVVSPDGHSRFLEAYHACDGVAVRATFSPMGGSDGDVREVVVPVAPPLGSRCAGSRSDPVAALPLAWGPRGLEAIVAGQLVLFKERENVASVLPAALDQGGPPGAPRSTGGAVVAFALPSGVLVKGPNGKAVRVTATELEPYAELRQCVASEDGTRVACVRQGKVVAALVDR